ncbi:MULTISPECIES: hypothetical protein [unclassified Streptomyces]|uniref:hypothetical protein n=1 Tax=unclassified Streptomyces TaxID=2593676 RepID=UPI00035CF22C|nr:MULTISPECIES: hypothetical protein [unclassified Streptomyces]MYX39003.1 hypothetical protein [Streptomyces sp. SID8377]
MYPHYELPSERVIAYTAAMIDGEGSICIQGSHYQVNITQGVVNDGEDLCRWFAEVWGFGYVGCHQGARKNMHWRWAVAQTHQLDHLLTACLPDMRVKKQKAIDALEWIHGRIAEGRRCHWMRRGPVVARPLGSA